MPILTDIKAQAHAKGNHIDLSWLNPNAADYPGVRIIALNIDFGSDENFYIVNIFEFYDG